MASQPLSIEYIESLTEIWEGFSLMDQHGVAKENCQSLDDMKERLKLHYLRQRGEGRSTEAVSMQSKGPSDQSVWPKNRYKL